MQKKNNITAIVIIASLFFIFGFVTWINGALIPFMKTINELTETQSYLVASASYISFVVMALPASYILNKIGYRKGMSLGLIIMAIGALVFIPAAEARTYWVFLTGIFIQGYGLGVSKLFSTENNYTMFTSPVGGSGNVLINDIVVDVSGTNSSVFALEDATGFNATEFNIVNFENCKLVTFVYSH